MDLLELIHIKRAGNAWSSQQIEFLCQCATRNEEREQLSAALMAIFLQGMNEDEIRYLTHFMARSGEYINPGDLDGLVVDKHSTGGVGDKVSLVLVPMLAASGAKVAKLSGRGLGHTGGTIDKLESFVGIRTNLSIDDFTDQVRNHGIALSGQTANFVPADRNLYQLRDLTGTVESMPLIASSIMSKKIAAGADAIVLDVKVGGGATLQQVDQAIHLADLMISIGNNLGRRTEAFLTQMDQPLGHAIGNLLEVEEAIETLRGKGPSDLLELCYRIGSRMLVMAAVAPNDSTARQRLELTIESGLAIQKFREIVRLQGGSLDLFEATSWPRAPLSKEVLASRSGLVQIIDARQFGHASMLAGAGRRTKKDVIDPLAGIMLHHKIGDEIEEGQPIYTIYSSEESKLQSATLALEKAMTIGRQIVSKPEVILGHRT